MIDEWRRKKPDQPTRTVAIRRLLAQSLASSLGIQRTSEKAASKASQMAAKEIDRLADTSVAVEEQAKRKRRLLNGPREFRSFRKDHPRQKG
jgi:hypothetical protein